MFHAQRGLDVVGRERVGGHARTKRAHAADVGRQVVRGQVREVVEEAGADQRAEGRRAELDDALDEVDRGDAILAVRAHVVADHEGAVGPADEHRPVETAAASMIEARSSAQRPAVGVVLGLERRLGHAVAAQVERDEPELVGQRALVLLRPAEVVLRPAVDEQDRRRVRRSPLADVEPQAAAARDRVRLLARSASRSPSPPLVVVDCGPIVRRAGSAGASGTGALSLALAALRRARRDTGLMLAARTRVRRTRA